MRFRVFVAVYPLLASTLMFSSNAGAREIDVTPSTLSSALSGLMPGDNVRLAAGTYAHFTIANAVGTAAKPIVISGPGDGSAIVQADLGPCCNTIQIDGNVSYVVLRNLTIDGLGVEAATGIDARGADVHHVTIENCTLTHHDAGQQTVAISTKMPTSGWILRGNRIIGAGTGMYLGNSDGNQPFVQGLIENNLFYDTIGYNMQIKWQLPHEPVVGASGSPSATVIRHNVFIKTDRPSDSGDRPNLLVGGFPATGANSEDTYEIYGNVFAHNPRESLIQASGRVSIHDNVLFDAPGNAIRLTNHDLPLRRAWVYNNTFFVTGTAISFGVSAPEGSRVTGNLIFAEKAIVGPAGDVLENVIDTPANAALYVKKPGTNLGSVDFFPIDSRAAGSPLDLSAFAGDIDSAHDFNCRPKGDETFRGAYAGSGTNLGWAIAMENKPSGAACASAPRIDGGVPSGGPGPTGDAGAGANSARFDSSAAPEENSGDCACKILARRSASSWGGISGALAVATALGVRMRRRPR